MAVFQEQGPDGCRFIVRPNCAMSWRTTKYLIGFFAACLFAVGAYFSALGAWMVLPFAGLELAVLAAGFYFSALAGHQREIVEIVGPVVRVMRGGRRLVEVASFPANWTQVVLHRDSRGWYPGRLLLRCHGRWLQIAASVVEAEREELAAALEERLGFGYLWEGEAVPGAARAAAVSRSEELPAAKGAKAFYNNGISNAGPTWGSPSGEGSKARGKQGLT